VQRASAIAARKTASSAVFLAVIAVLPACSAGAPAAGSPSASADPSAAEAVFAFTVAGVRPVLPNGSQDTHAQTPEAGCDPVTLAADKALGAKVAGGFALGGFPVSASLLRHFLSGQGTAVNYPSGSPISKKALASRAFRVMNDEVQEAILSQLKAGRSHLRLSAAQLPAVAFESAASDLYWGFRGTQGLSLSGSGRRENGRYTGTLSYLIRDSYGFQPDDTLNGFGAPMRYLQTMCGAPQHAGGARWFPDTIAVTVPFNRPA
jgi:hypothetical protein